MWYLYAKYISISNVKNTGKKQKRYYDRISKVIIMFSNIDDEIIDLVFQTK